MLIKSKFLGDAGWKDLAAKNKLKDPGLAKSLERLKRTGDEAYDEQARALEEVVKLIAVLKKDKTATAAPAVVKYVGEMQGDAEAALRDVAKARAEHDKAMKAKAEADKAAAKKASEQEDEEDEDVESPELLTTKLKPLLKLVAKGETMHALLAKSGKQVVVMLSRKPIPPARRKLLAEQLGGGSTKYYPGTCGLEAGATTFALKAEVAGMSKLVKTAVLEQTGLRLNKIKCRGEDGDDHDDDDDTPVADAKVPEAAGAGGRPGDRAEPLTAAPGGAQAAPAPAAPGDLIGSPPAAVAPIDDASTMPDEVVAEDICNKQLAILKGWETALTVFATTMTSSADAEASPDLQGVVLKHVREKVVGELIKRTPMAAEVKGLADAIDGELQRASAAQASATLRDFVNRYTRMIGQLVQTTMDKKAGFVEAVRKRREAAGVDLPSSGGGRAGGKKPAGRVEVNPKSLEDWTAMRLALMDTLTALKATLAASSSEKLLRVLTETWIRQGTTGTSAGQPIAAVIIIRLNPDYSVKNAHLQASGGQKLAEELLKESPSGVDVYGLKARKRILHYDEHDVPQATLELDAANKDVTAPALQTPKYTELKKRVLGRGLPPTTTITGD